MNPGVRQPRNIQVTGPSGAFVDDDIDFALLSATVLWCSVDTEPKRLVGRFGILCVDEIEPRVFCDDVSLDALCVHLSAVGKDYDVDVLQIDY